MTSHITVRLAWHNDGWNGHVCKKPEKNVYCVGCHSYPGEMIREKRDLDWEQAEAGKKFINLEQIPACVYSGSAFSKEESLASAEPPAFFNDTSEPVEWQMSPATACIWPYDAMFNREGVKNPNGTYNYDNRFKFAQEHFDSVQGAQSLVFYYANYSNPFSTEEKSRYVLVGVSRVKKIGQPHFYINCSEEIKKKYHNGFVWQREVTSHYPEQGVRLPYHCYKDDLSTAEKFAVFPEQTHICKYGSKIISDDEALGVIEQFLNSARVLRDNIKDTNENWDIHIDWLESLISELWLHRGRYPGLPAVLEYLKLNEFIALYKENVERDSEEQIYQSIIDFIKGDADQLTDLVLSKDKYEILRRNALLCLGGDDEIIDLVCNVLPRFAITKDQISRVVSENRSAWGISASLSEISQNPYLLAEQYIGMDDSDTIVWSIIDRGCIPSPELGLAPVCENNDKRRIRGILLETIRRNTQHVFIKASQMLEQVNIRMEYLPEWKRTEVKKAYLNVDKVFYNEAITYRDEENEKYLYDALVWQDESELRERFLKLLSRQPISSKRVRTKNNWIDALKNEKSSLYISDDSREDYLQAIESQADACVEIFNKAFSVLSGGAGTGKSTVATAYLNAISQIEGSGSAICVLTPTGKAADRLRSELQNQNIHGIEVVTIHSILAKHSWLNKNMTIKREGSRLISNFKTIIIDESSMIDTCLFASLNRAIDWDNVSRLLLVGDPAQLPPIGIGKVFADIVDYIREEYSGNIVRLTVNLRQMSNRSQGKGTGIVDVASLFRNQVSLPMQDRNCLEIKQQKLDRDELLQKIQDGGAVNKDLNVQYWSEDDSLSEKIIRLVAEDMGKSDESAEETWQRALKENVISFQILSPVRGDEFGTEAINLACQKFKSASWAQRGTVDGFHLFDKFIQVVNRTKSNPIRAWDHKAREKVDLEIFNGEIGTLCPKPAEYKRLGWQPFIFRDFTGKLVNKDHLSIEYFGRAKDSPENNIELAYAISVHKSQGSEFERVYFVIPKASSNRQMMELIYTGITRASQHCTLLIEDNVSSLIDHARPEKSALAIINSSLFDFKAVPDELMDTSQWYESGKIHRSLMGSMLRSKSEVIVADLLFKHDLQPWYEKPLSGKDGLQYLPDFTISYEGNTYYWEHLGMLEKPEYLAKWETKKKWYFDNDFGENLIISKDRAGAIDSSEIENIIKEKILGIDVSEQRKSWDEILELCDDETTKNFAKEALRMGLLTSVWGFEFQIDDEVVGEFEFAWPDKKVAVLIADNLDDELIQKIEDQDWNLFEFDQLPIKKLVKVLQAMLA